LPLKVPRDQDEYYLKTGKQPGQCDKQRAVPRQRAAEERGQDHAGDPGRSE
jgi:hypothetical protein